MVDCILDIFERLIASYITFRGGVLHRKMVKCPWNALGIPIETDDRRTSTDVGLFRVLHLR